jgi:hypothetical protein
MTDKPDDSGRAARTRKTRAQKIEQIVALLGKRVTVTNPDLPDATWTGVLTGRYDEPTVTLEMADGADRALPQRFDLAEAADRTAVPPEYREAGEPGSVVQQSWAERHGHPYPESAGRLAMADAYCTTCRQVQTARILPGEGGWECTVCGDPPAAVYAQFAAWARGTAPIPPSLPDAQRAFPGVPEPVLGAWFVRLAEDEEPDDDEIFARYAAEMPRMTVDVHQPVCGNCQATSALEDMRAALRCVLLPWLDEQEDPVTARRLRSDIEARLDEVEDMINMASHRSER